MNDYHKIIKVICDELNITFTLLSKNWVIMLKKNNIVKYITGYKFDINTQGTSNIVNDKYALCEVLKANNIPIIEHEIIYSPTNNSDYAQGSNSYEYVKNYFYKNNNHIVIKSNMGTCGNEVFEVNDADEINNYLDKLFLNNHSLSMCPYYNIENEYRAIILNQEIILLYKKIKPSVIGDGKSKIRELLLSFNPIYFEDKLSDKKYDRILESGEQYQYNWQFNLSKGAKIEDVDGETRKQIASLAKKVSNIINLGFGSIDIIKTNDNKLYVMEANSGVMMINYIKQKSDGYIKAKEIYKKAIEAMFK